MRRYIDADKLQKDGWKLRREKHGLVTSTYETMELDCVPTADVVEVVRCKDCKWHHEIGCAINIVDESDEPTDNDYCSFGERKEE